MMARVGVYTESWMEFSIFNLETWSCLNWESGWSSNKMQNLSKNGGVGVEKLEKKTKLVSHSRFLSPRMTREKG